MAADASLKPTSFEAGELLGKVLDDRYRLESLLGQGGMGMVFKATQTAVGRQVAVKTLNPALAMAPTFFERFKREAEVASRLKHPNIVTLFDFGKTPQGLYYIVMELLEGDSLRQKVRQDGPMSLRRAAAVVEQITLGLQHAHKAHVIHRDMKPHNVMVTEVDGAEYVKVLDFGLVKAGEDDAEEQLTSTGQVLGTPQYMPPEQASGEPVDARSDLYSVGAIFHFCLTGSSPYGANSVRKALTAALTQPLPSVASKRSGAPVPHAIEDFLRKALAKEPKDRYQTAEEFLADLDASLKGVSDADLDALPQRPLTEAGKDLGSQSDVNAKATPHSRAGKSRSRPLPKGPEEKPEPVHQRVTAPEIPSLLQAATRTSPPARRAGGVPTPLKLALAILPLAGVVGGAVAYFLKPHEAPLPPPLAPQTSPRAATPPPRIEDSVTVTLRSQPPGAAVIEEGVIIGTTPLQQKWTKDAVKSLTFQLAGYKDEQRAFKLQHDETIEVELESARKPTRPPNKKDKNDPPIDAFE